MLRPFDYHRPKTLEEACALGRSLPDAMFLAGGTDLLVKIRDGKSRPRHVIDIKGIASLERIRRDGDALLIGALATVTDVLHAEEVRREPALALLLQAARVFGCEEIRHRATICGNIAHGSPGSEFGPPMHVLEATCVIHGPEGERRVPIAEFPVGAGKTVLRPGEILTALRVPVPAATARSAYLRLSRVRGMDLAALNCALLVVPSPSPHAGRHVRVSFGAVAEKPLRLPELERVLSNGPITAKVLAVCSEILGRDLSPRATSLRASQEYKKAMAPYLLETALKQTLGSLPEEP